MRVPIRQQNRGRWTRMSNSTHIPGKALLAAGLSLLLGLADAGLARSPIPYEKPPPPVVDDPPPGTNTGRDPEPPPEDSPPPGGGTSHMPEPATLVSGLIGAGILALRAARRKKDVVVER
jgi:hypothetical protein